MRHREAWSAFAGIVFAGFASFAAASTLSSGVRWVIGSVALLALMVAALMLGHRWPFDRPDNREPVLAEAPTPRLLASADQPDSPGSSVRRRDPFRKRPPIDVMLDSLGSETPPDGLGDLIRVHRAPPSGLAGSAVSDRAMANLLMGELEESLDIIGEALASEYLWSANVSLPSGRWRQYEDRIAELGPETHKPVRDAYRKLDRARHWARERHAEGEHTGVIVASPSEWGRSLGEAGRGYLEGVRGVVRHAIDALHRIDS